MEKASEGVAILLNNRWHIAVVDFGCSRVKVCVLVGYGPNEGHGEESDRFWNDMDRTLDRVRNGYRLCMLGDLNELIGDRVRADITGAFVVSGEHDNERQ